MEQITILTKSLTERQLHPILIIFVFEIHCHSRTPKPVETISSELFRSILCFGDIHVKAETIGFRTVRVLIDLKCAKYRTNDHIDTN